MFEPVATPQQCATDFQKEGTDRPIGKYGGDFRIDGPIYTETRVTPTTASRTKGLAVDICIMYANGESHATGRRPQAASHTKGLAVGVQIAMRTHSL